MLTFSLGRMVYLVFGIVFLSFSALFLLSKRRPDAMTGLGTAFLAVFGVFLVLLACWNSLSSLRILSHIASVVVGLGLVPIGLTILRRFFGEPRFSLPWLVTVLLATVLVATVCSILFWLEIDKAWPLTICYAYAFATYGGTLVQGLRKLGSLRGLPFQLTLFLFFLGLCVILLGAIMVFQAVKFDTVQYGIWIGIDVLFCFMAAILYRHPGAFAVLVSQSNEVRYRRTLLASVHVPSKIQRIEKLMRIEEVYRDPDFRLEQLAKLVSLKPYQLTELLNVHMKQSFSEYVMGFRLDRAQRELTSPQGGSILEVAFSSGFRSKSTFNEAFRKATGQTPTAYREAARTCSER